MQRCSTGTARDEASSYLTKEASTVGERGHRLTGRCPPFLGEEQALAVKDANPRNFARCRLDRSSGPGCRLFKASDEVGTILALLGVAFRFLTSLVKRMRRLWAGFTRSRPFFCSPCSKGGPDGTSLRLLNPRR
jgi:hypothetical protein